MGVSKSKWLKLEDLFRLADKAKESDECLRLNYGLCSGYPTIRVKGKRIQVSRLILARKLGRELEPNMEACHTCDTPSCINDRHLYEGTHKKNITEAISKGHLRPWGWKGR